MSILLGLAVLDVGYLGAVAGVIVVRRVVGRRCCLWCCGAGCVREVCLLAPGGLYSWSSSSEVRVLFSSFSMTTLAMRSRVALIRAMKPA